MGYYTNYILEFVEGEPVELSEQQVVKDLIAFMQKKGIDQFDEFVAVRMVTELHQHFNLIKEFDADVFARRLDEVCDCSWIMHPADNQFSLDEAKWYDHEEHMELLSAEFPTVAFILTGEGEKFGDAWKKTYRAGKKIREQNAVVRFED